MESEDGVSKTGIKIKDGFYLAKCKHCGWKGCSSECGTDTCGDDSEVYCPVCYRPGADVD